MLEAFTSLLETVCFLVSCVAFIFGYYDAATWFLAAAIYWHLVSRTGD